MREISLTQGHFALVDDEDFERVSKINWRLHRDRGGVLLYACNTVYCQSEPRQRTLFLHKFILGITDNKRKVDHKNHNGLDCQRKNLRVASFSQNGANARKRTSKCSSIYKGVSWDGEKRLWRARINKDYRVFSLGRFKKEEAAASAYNKAAKFHFGEFASLNAIAGERICS